MSDEITIEKTKEGKLICPDCGEPMNRVFQTQYDDITWIWDEKKKEYTKKCGGSSEKPKCGECEGTLPWEYGEELGY